MPAKRKAKDGVAETLHDDDDDDDEHFSGTDDEDPDPAETCFRQAKTSRTSRAARPPSPSERAKTEAWRLANLKADELESKDLVRMGRMAPPSWHLTPRFTMRGSSASTISTGTSSQGKGKKVKQEPKDAEASQAESTSGFASTSHVLALHAKGVSIGQSEPAYLSYYQHLPPRVTALSSGSMRSGSVRASIVGPHKKDKAGGSQQTTRVNQLDLLAAWASGATAVAVTLGIAKAHIRKHGLQPANPACTYAVSGLDILTSSPRVSDLFFTTSTARLLVHALPTRLRTFSFLDTMASVASKELDVELLSSDVRQTSTALTSICKLVTEDKKGLTVWASWILLCFMSSDSRLRSLMEPLHITDMDLAVANVYQAWGRAEVTRRARLKTSKLQSIVNRFKTYMEEKCIQPEILAKMKQEADEASQQLKDERLWVISAKRKRGDLASQSTSSGQSSAAGGFCEYWEAAFESEFSEVLKAVITRSKTSAEQATLANLRGQLNADVVATNDILVNVATRNAVSSAQAVAHFVLVGNEDVPQSMTWVCRDHNAQMQSHIGISRSSEDLSNSSIHVCKLAPRNLQPRSAIPHTVLTWSLGVRNTTPSDPDSSVVPAVVETYAHLQALRRLHTIQEQEYLDNVDDDLPNGSVVVFDHPLQRPSKTFFPKRAEKLRQAVLDRAKKLASEGAMPSTLSGVSRSKITFRARIVQPQSAHAIGNKIADSMVLHAQSRFPTDIPSMHESVSCRALHRSTLDAPQDPIATPASNLGLSLEVNECVRSMKRGKTNGNSPCRMFAGVANPTEMNEKAINEHDRPVMILPIVDVEVEHTNYNVTSNALPSRPDACLQEAVITFTVAGDSPIRIPECLSLFEKKVHRLRREEQTGGRVLDTLMEAMGVLLASAIRSSELNDVSNSMVAGGVNTAIASAKRIPLADKNVWMLLTPYQCYRTGLIGPPLELVTTAWAQTARVGFDMGTSGASGIKASAYVADQRHHGKLLSSPSQVDELCVDSGTSHYMQVDSKRYSAIPVECRGIPHMGLPNVHRCYESHDSGLETIRKEAGITEATSDNIQCLAFGPYSERLPPHIVESADPTCGKQFRNPCDSMNSAGLAFQVDGTLADLSIMRAPLIRRLSTTSPRDNLFASAHPYVQVFFNAMCTFALLARTAFRTCNPKTDQQDPDASPATELRFLFDLIHAFHTGSPIPKGSTFLWASHACILLNVCYPADTAIAVNIIHDVYAMAPSVCVDVMKEQAARGDAVVGAPLTSMGFSEHGLRAANSFWTSFSRNRNVCKNAWDAISPLLERILERDGTYDNTLADINLMALDLDTALRAVWIVHSPDGTAAPVAPSALAGVANTTRILAKHMEPIFVGRVNADGSREDARGSVIGCMPCAYHQILTLLMGAHIDGTNVQYSRNEGQLCYRPSSAADVLTKKRKHRSCKSISLFGTEGDEQCAGTRDEKLAMCRLQRLAWKQNISIMKPLFYAIAIPKPDSIRIRGDRESVLFRQERRFQYSLQQKTTNLEQSVADAFAAATKRVFELQ